MCEALLVFEGHRMTVGGARQRGRIQDGGEKMSGGKESRSPK